MSGVVFPGIADVERWHQSVLCGFDAMPELARRFSPNISLINLELAERLQEIRTLTSQEWEVEKNELEEKQEIYALIVLFASFEGIIRRDFEWRSRERKALHHALFSKIIPKKVDGFVSVINMLNQWLSVARNGVHVDFEQKIAALINGYRDERNILVHGNWIVATPFAKLFADLIDVQACFKKEIGDFCV